jgi:hypothetical protein
MAESRASYAASHRDRANLVLHLFAVPLFVLAAGAFGLAALRGDTQGMLTGVAGVGASLAAQGFGHRREDVRPARFTGTIDVITRVPVEQFWGFWVFLFSGAWWRQLRGRG